MTKLDEAWKYFDEHYYDIREVVRTFLPVEQWQSMVGPFGEPSEHTMKDFEAAVTNKNHRKLLSIMNDAWGRAPESRAVYSIPGFTPMCNLLDGTVEGFLEDEEDGQLTT
jgi:hypothetical protein